MSKDELGDDQTRRSFVKKAVYVAPVIVTLDAIPAFASHECSWHTKEEKDKEKDKENHKWKNEEYYEEKEKKEKNGN